MIKDLPENEDFLIISTYKNLGPAVIERSKYIEHAWSEHLSDTDTYEVIPANKVDALKAEMRYIISQFHARCFRAGLPPDELTFLSRLKSNSFDRLTSKFYMTAKVHKPKLKFKPVVCCCHLWHNASRHNKVGGLSSPMTHSRVKDCFEVKEEMEHLGQLPEGTCLMDATSMYTNIDTDHGLHILEQFFEINRDKLPAGFPTKLILEAVKIVMRFNVFEFDGTIIKQLTGTAMGTPMACTYSMIYYAYHETSTLLHKYRRHLLYYKRFIDDGCGCGLWNDLDNPSAWDIYVMNYFKYIIVRRG